MQFSPTKLSVTQYLTTPSAWDRRTFLKAAGIAASWPFLQQRPTYAADRQITLSDHPFQLGVASGDPSPDGVVLWTRLAPQPLEGGGMPPEDVPVQWVVASDSNLKNVVQRGTAVASKDWAHCVHVEVAGLEPDRVYWYQFIAAGEASPIGRTRTAPSPGKTLDRFRFAFASCQHYESGLFTAYDHMSRDDLNLVVHLGDYIYEGKGTPAKVRQHVGLETVTLDDYRNRHAQYKTDLHLQAAHAAFPWLVTWDDHEFDNNCAGDISEEKDVDPIKFLERRANAYKAYYEHMPLRRSALPAGPWMTLYRTVSFGPLVQFAVLDTRQYRTDQPCGDHNVAPCETVFDPNATVLGQQQDDWLRGQLSKSRAQWNVLAQQIMMGRVDRQPGEAVAWSMDQWAGYDAARKRLLQFLADQKVANPVVLTGDIHTNWVNDLKVDFDNLDSPTVATEFVGTSITSGGDGAETRKDTAGVLTDNPFVKFYNAERGYVRCEVDSKHWRSEYQVTPTVTKPDSPLVTRATFEIESGRPGAERV
ncbi:alkaline phosphatase D family protein [Planctomicrobium piriforme]|nr:alkaline phosphatase D family protein [Planctomicrobium piriforme]